MADLPITSDAGATPVVINDPTTIANVANVKAGSTAPVAADNALVITESPNSPVKHVIVDSGSITTALASAITTGSTSSIGASAVQIHSGSLPAATGVTIRSSTTNTDLIYFGPSSVTANTTAATDGLPLKIGESITMPITNINLVYGISPTAGQKVFWMVL